MLTFLALLGAATASLPPAPIPAAHTPCDPNAKPPEQCPGATPCPKSGVCPTPKPPPPPGPPTPPKPKPPPPPPANQTCIDKNHTMWTCVCGGWSSTQFDCDLDCHCGQKCTKVCCKTEWCKNGSVALPPSPFPRVPRAALPEGATATYELDPEAPAEFTVSLGTDNNGGEIVIEVLREWAPLGVDRFYAALKDGFYDDSALFRVVPNFVLQFGIAGTPEMNERWQTTIPDDPVLQSNVRGTISFATAGPNTRTTQLFINYVDNPGLDAQGFAPIGRVVTGMEVADTVFNPTPGDQGGVNQAELRALGISWARATFPGINSITEHMFIEKMRAEWREPCNVGQEWPDCENRMPTARQGLAGCAWGTKIFALGGEQFNQQMPDAEVLDTATGQWTSIDPIILPRSQAAAAADGLGRVYLLGGFAREGDVLVPVNSVVSVDAETGQWREDTPMPTPRALCGGILYGGRIYVMGGRSMEPFLPNPFQPVVEIVESMDVLTGEWRREGDMPEPNQGGAYAVVGTKIYVIGGGNGNGAELATMFIWDVEADVWSRGPDMITARTLTMATVYNNKIYVIGGSGGADSNTAVESFNVLTNEWQAETSLPDSRWQSLAAAPVGGGRIYAVGGEQ